MDENSEKLRAKAKEELRQGKRIDTSVYETDLKVLVEELSIYQIELEHQNQELIQSQEQIQQSKDRYLDLFDNAPIGYLIIDSNGIIKDINQTACLLLESSKPEFLNNKITKFIHPDYQDIYYHFFQTLIHQKHHQPCDIKLRKANNHYFYARIQGIRQSESIANEPEFRLAIIDVTIQKEMEHKLLAAKEKAEQNEEKLKAAYRETQSILDSISDAFFTLDNNMVVTRFNKEAEIALGKKKEEVIGHVLFDVFTEARGSIFEEKYCLALKEKKSLSFETYFGLAPYQNWYNVQVYPNAEGISIFFQLITERKQAEAKIKESEERFRKTIEFSPIPIAIAATNGELILLNKQFINTYGYTLEEIPTIGKWFELAYPNEEYRNFVLNDWSKEVDYSIQNNIPVNVKEYFVSCKNGEVKTVAVSAYFEKDILIGLFQDFTELKKTEFELVKAKERAVESDRLKSAFLANMSHEIRTPMNGILGFAELLKEPDLTGEQQLQYLKIIEKSGVRMLNIINDIVDISKIEAGLMKLDMKETNINEQIEYIYTFFKPEVEAKGMKLFFRNSLPAREAILTTDREKVYAILTNLVKNAIKYSKKGSIELGYEIVETHGRASLQFYVKDTGIGIPKNRQEAIFERFIQADIVDVQAQQGAGLGLAITKTYVEMLCGKIWVESEEGIGSTFYFTLPYHTEPIEEKAEQQVTTSDKTNQVKKLKILIAEDDEISELLLKNTLKAYSNKILKVRNGIEAIESCHKNEDIDLILMDIRMPDMDGYEATRLIREFNQEVVIIAQTAYGLTGDKKKALEVGCNDYIAKPINKDELLSIIQKYFKKQ